MSDVRLYNADCLQILPMLSGVDAVITDPPFGIAYKNRRGDIRPHVQFADQLQGDADTEIGQRCIDACFAHGWPLCAFAHHQKPWSGSWRQWLVWDKGPAVGGGGDPPTCWKYTWEVIQVGGFGELNGQRDSAVLRFWIGQSDFPFHPTQKPLSLMRYLIEKLTQPGDTILDPFAGSGSTLIAAIQTGRNAIGIEKDTDYFAVAERRIAEAQGVGTLFPAHPVPAATLLDALTD